jgi:iron complex transport system substrate-binding protein
MRIVSLFPGATEIVRALGLEGNLVGVSHECILPPKMADLPRVTTSLIPPSLPSADIDRFVRERAREKTALYGLRRDFLEDIGPDLIITQTLCQVCAVSEEEVHAVAHALPNPPAIVDLEPTTIAGLLRGIREVAPQGGAAATGERLIAELEGRITQVVGRGAKLSSPPRVAFLEWLDPIFSSGHWNPELVRLAGGVELLGIEGEPARVIAWEDVVAADPEVLFISCCGFTVERTLEDFSILTRRPEWTSLPAVRNGRVFVADGTRWFSSPGPELIASLEILAHALDPVRHPLPGGLLPALRVGE